MGARTYRRQLRSKDDDIRRLRGKLADGHRVAQECTQLAVDRQKRIEQLEALLPNARAEQHILNLCREVATDLTPAEAETIRMALAKYLGDLAQTLRIQKRRTKMVMPIESPAGSGEPGAHV